MISNPLHKVLLSSLTCFKKATLCVFLLFCFSTGFSQTQKSLEAQRERLQLEIKKVNNLLFSTKKQEKSLLNQVGDLNKKIKVRTKLINTITQETEILTDKVNKNSQKIKQLKEELRVLKEDYAEMVYKSYKSKSSQNRMMFILSSESFHQAYKRYQYMSQYNAYRKKQGLEIIAKTDQIEAINNTLTVQKIQKENLMYAHKEEQVKIEHEKKQQEGLISKVKSKEKKYIAEIRAKQAEERRIDQKIEKLIREAIEASRRAAIEAARIAALANKGSETKTETKSTASAAASPALGKFSLTPEAKILASKFEQNRGRLPWPVSNALVVREFGKIPHESIPGITIESNGIHIATNQNSDAKAIFEGTVLAIQLGSAGEKTVMLLHGNYISLYSNLETISVQKGQRVSLNQTLGRIHTDKVTGKTILKFQIWRDTSKENPKSWLLRL